MTPVEKQVQAIRERVALTDLAHVSVVRVGGDDAFDLVDAVSPRNLYIQDSQALQTVFLDQEGQLLADVEICRDDEEFLLFVEGVEIAQLIAYLETHKPAGDIVLSDMRETHRLLSLNGPYSWELLGELAGPEVIGLPYLSLAHDDEWLCFRSGKTGEYGYHLLIEADLVEGISARISHEGGRFGMAEVGVEALDLCSLENGFLCMRREGGAGISPLELQLQWRITSGKPCVGSLALDAKRGTGISRRVIPVTASGPLSAGDSILHDGKEIGTIIAADASPTLGCHIGLAHLDVKLAHPGISVFEARENGSPVLLRTQSQPLINNRSLHVNPQSDSYFTPPDQPYPPIAP